MILSPSRYRTMMYRKLYDTDYDDDDDDDDDNDDNDDDDYESVYF